MFDSFYTQKYLQKQTEQQAVEQGVSHDVLGQLLFTAECYAVGKNSERHFKAYEIAGSSIKSKKKLREQLLILTDSFKYSYKFFNFDYKDAGGYEFPEGMEINQIVALFEYWKSLVSKEDKAIYDKTINLLQKKKKSTTTPYPKYNTDNFTKKENPTSVDIGNMINFQNSLQHSNENLTKKIIENYHKNGEHYKGKIIVDAKESIDPVLRILNGNMSEKVPGVSYPKEVVSDGMDDIK